MENPTIDTENIDMSQSVNNQTENTQDAMQENRNRYLEMLRAAAPYAPRHARNSLDVVIQIQDIASKISGNQRPLAAASMENGENADLEACDMEGDAGDTEAMLMQISNFCTPREQDTIHMILNFVRAGKLFRNYQNFMQDRGESDADLEASEATGPFGGNRNNIIEFLLTQLTPEQKSTFDMMKMMVDN